MAAVAGKGGSTATDLADSLAAQGMPFRKAHEIVGKFVLHGKSEDKNLKLPTARESVEKRNSYGAPGPKAMSIQIREAEKLLSKSGFLRPY